MVESFVHALGQFLGMDIALLLPGSLHHSNVGTPNQLAYPKPRPSGEFLTVF